MEELKVGLVGCGVISRTHLKAFQKTEACRVHGVFDLNRELAEQRAADFNIATIYEDLDSLIAECDVVDVCTPPQTHATIALQVIEAGKDLLIEKPIVIDLDDWRKMEVALTNSASRLSVIHNLKFTNALLQARDWIDAGKIGHLIRMQIEVLTDPVTDRMIRGDSHWSRRLPGGRWFETMPHQLYMAFCFGGAMELDQVSVLNTSRATSGAPADEVIVVLKNEDCLATIHYSSNCQLNRRTFTLIGSEGRIEIDVSSDAARYHTLNDATAKRPKRALGISFIETWSTLVRMIPDRSRYIWDHVTGETAHARQIMAFDRYLQGKEPSPTSIEEIQYVVAYSHKIGRAIDQQVASLDPAKV